MDDHLQDDVYEQILPEGIPDAKAAVLYRALTVELMPSQWQPSPSDATQRFAHERLTIEKERAQKPKTLWYILNRSLRDLFGGSK